MLRVMWRHGGGGRLAGWLAVVAGGAAAGASGPSALAGFILPPDQTQIISSTTLSGFSRGFDAAGRIKRAATFSKTTLETTLERGWSAETMLVARIAREELRPEFIDDPAYNRSWSVMAGARHAIGAHGSWRFSAQAMAGYGSNLDRRGFMGDARLIAARDLAILDRPAFVEFQAGYRHGGGVERNELRLDATLGLHLGENWLALAQLFGAHAPGAPGRPASWRLKAGLGLVWKVSERWSVQLGGFTTPAGVNAGFESGVTFAVWRRF